MPAQRPEPSSYPQSPGWGGGWASEASAVHHVCPAQTFLGQGGSQPVRDKRKSKYSRASLWKDEPLEGWPLEQVEERTGEESSQVGGRLALVGSLAPALG